jgi:predicted MFS family arabinose efflux permease
MLPLELFRSRNFAVGNVATLAFYGSLSASTFFIVVFLQQVAGYAPVAAGAALMPMSILTFLLAKRFGALADRHGPRLFMGVGPILAAGGLFALLAVGADAPYASEVLPGVMLFAFGLAMTVAPLTAAVLGAVEAGHSGVASAVNNAVARVAGLVAIAAVGAGVAGQFASRVDTSLGSSAASPALRQALAHARSRTLEIDVAGFPRADRTRARAVLVGASVDGFHLAILIAAALSLTSGVISLAGIANGRREVAAEECPGGALCGASTDVAEEAEPAVV